MGVEIYLWRISHIFQTAIPSAGEMGLGACDDGGLLRSMEEAGGADSRSYGVGEIMFRRMLIDVDLNLIESGIHC